MGPGGSADVNIEGSVRAVIIPHIQLCDRVRNAADIETFPYEDLGVRRAGSADL